VPRAGTVPGTVPGSVPASVPGTVPGPTSAVALPPRFRHRSSRDRCGSGGDSGAVPDPDSGAVPEQVPESVPE
jgi:hypothetical protein